jgi:hypothetical protein
MFIDAFIKHVILPKQHRDEFKKEYVRLHKDSISRDGMLYYQFDKDLTSAKVIKKLVRKNLEKLKHDNWTLLNLTDNLYHEHEGVSYFSNCEFN